MKITDVINAIPMGLQGLRILDLIDILIIAYAIFSLIRLSTNTRSSQVLKGVGILLILFVLSTLLDLVTVRYLLSSFLVSGIVVAAVLFQPELRRGLERIGRFKINLTQRDTPSFEIVKQLTMAIENMSRKKIGALIVLERNTKLGDYVQTGTVIDAEISDALIENIFEPKTPLHDGAMIIRESRIYAAACVLPLFDDPNIARELGTRHRASLGVSTVSDSVTIVVSEETGIVSYAYDGRLVRNLDHDMIEELLNRHFNPQQDGGFQLFGKKQNGEKTKKTNGERIKETDGEKNGKEAEGDGKHKHHRRKKKSKKQ